MVRGPPRNALWTVAPTFNSLFFRVPPSPAFQLQPSDLAMVRTDMRLMFRVKAAPVLSCRIQSVKRPVKNGTAISPGEGEKYQV